MNPLRRFFLLVLLGAASIHPLFAQWVQTNGPYGGSIYALAVRSSNIFADTDGDGVFLSTNNGTSKDITVRYSPVKKNTMRVTSHSTFLEFQYAISASFLVTATLFLLTYLLSVSGRIKSLSILLTLPLLRLPMLPLMLVITITVQAQAQQTYALETSTFRLVFDRLNPASGLREVRYLGPPDTASFAVHGRWTNIEIVDDTTWDPPENVSVQSISDSVKELTFHYSPVKSSTMRVTAHRRFLEFELINITGQVGDIWMFNILFLMHNGPYQAHQYQQILPLDRGFVSFLTNANANTNIWRWTDNTRDLHNATSPRYVPSVGQYVRNQRFAYSICRREDLPQIVQEIEAYFGYPYGWSLKENPENNLDYLFLLDQDSVSSQNIIQLCRQTNLSSVMLMQFFWSDFRDQDEPFKPKPWIQQFISDLKAAGLVVGLHSYVHTVPAYGYYATHYPNSVSTVIRNGRRAFRFNDTLPELVASHYAEKVNTLGADWIFFDGQQHLYEEGGQLVNKYDWYLTERINAAIMNELRQRNHPLRIFQNAGEGTGGYHYTSRYGQTDYWDDLGSPPYRTPIGQMNRIVLNYVPSRFAIGTIELGWFGREIHIPIPPYRRDARWDEWQHLCSLSLAHNLPLGIRTTYNDFMTDPLRDSIVPLLRETIRRRRGLEGIPVADELSLLRFVLEQNFPNPFNLETRIRFKLPNDEHVRLVVYDLLGREVVVLLNEFKNAGSHDVFFTSSNLASGIYFYRLQAGAFHSVKKLLLLR